MKEPKVAPAFIADLSLDYFPKYSRAQLKEHGHADERLDEIEAALALKAEETGDSERWRLRTDQEVEIKQAELEAAEKTGQKEQAEKESSDEEQGEESKDTEDLETPSSVTPPTQ